jgi:RHS repeat-associated protein
MTESYDVAYSMHYRYGADGERAIKYNGTTGRETVYFNRLWQMNNTAAEWEQSKHIYVGETRIGTKNNSEGNENTRAEEERTYYYHGDHLGSAQVVTNHGGQVHERLEYTPYGELWIDRRDAGGDQTPYWFTGKELDEETGLYYYGARYLDPKASRWMSADPAMGEYIPGAPISDEARRRNGNLPGMGGVFNLVNLHVYHYAGNNPVKYIDPDGRIVSAITARYNMQGTSAHGAVSGDWGGRGIPPSETTLMQHGGCAVAFSANIAFTQGSQTVTPETIRGVATNFTATGGLIWGSALAGNNVTIADRQNGQLSAARFNELVNSTTDYYVGINVNYSGTTGNSGDHWVGASELVTRSDGGQYFRISPTSASDWVLGTNTNINGNNRGGRGWQTDTNAQGQITDIYVPLDQVKGYIIIQKQAQANESP